ncbi:class I tRNA ligase family protein [Candidatus Woesearchaeota archaeon]|nr:class I tRNA ligase family protein [Candidatus Woesearchaeota archaeon]
MELPQNYDPRIAEPKWQKYWQDHNLFKYNPKSKKPLYSIDTPPPYASADHLHVGHGMHYSQFEFVARYRRMHGFNVFFPLGYDDNGLPTERYVENKHNVNIYRLGFTIPHHRGQCPKSSPNFFFRFIQEKPPGKNRISYHVVYYLPDHYRSSRS